MDMVSERISLHTADTGYRAYIAHQAIEAGEVLLDCSGLVLLFDDFRKWRLQAKANGNFDAPTQVAYHVFEMVETLRILSANTSLQHILHLYPSQSVIDQLLIPHHKLADATEAADAAMAHFGSSVVGLGGDWSLLVRLKLILDCNSHHFGAHAADLACFPTVAVGLHLSLSFTYLFVVFVCFFCFVFW
eukprot:m.132410 g.132410  ORF g.132410 m.132410 type:complete len:189 (+) comp52384_c0_seq2:79-645(+)